MKKALHLTLLLLAIIPASANRVSIQSAQTVAVNFFKLNANLGKNPSANASLAYTRQEEDGTVDYYVFNISPKGFVIVSADDNLKPVIGYSLESNFTLDTKRSGVKDWMAHAAEHIYAAIQRGSQADSRITGLWNSYNEGIKPSNAKSGSTVAPMLTTKWDQEPFYNDLCPYSSADSMRTVTGCVATAMAQIMKYWNYPAQGTGSYAYNDLTPMYSYNYGVQTANFGSTTYQWSNMPDSLSASNTAVATLMYHCGVAVAMDYGDDWQGGSGAFVMNYEVPSWRHTAEKAYPNYFLYNPTTIQGLRSSGYSSSAWVSLIENELNHSRPVQYEAFDTIYGGHTWVCDGYDVNDMIHMNWGWSGIDNGYFSLSSLSVDGYNFTSSEGALIGIEPIVNLAVTTLVADSAICSGNATTISAVGSVSAANYSWTPTSGLSCPTCAVTTASPAATTTYYVTMDSSGFTVTDSITVNVRPGLNLDSVMVHNANCYGSSDGSVNLYMQQTASYNFVWSNGETTSSLSGVSAGNYALTITDANGCFYFLSEMVSEPTSLALSVSTVNITCNTVYGSASANVTGGAGNYFYNWNTGATAATITGLTVGAYEVTATDANGCSASTRVNIEQPNPMILTIEASNTNGTPSGSVSISGIANGVAPYTFNWNNGDTDKAISNLAPGFYEVTVTDSKGCMQTASATVGGTLDTTTTIATSINDLKNALSFNIYPNPASSQISIQMGAQHNGTTYSIKNTLGQTLVSSSISDLVTQIDLSSYASGVYFIELMQGEKTNVKEFIKK